jgi:hypothetical protein
MEIKDILVPLIVGLGSSYITYYFALKSKTQEAMRVFKERAYEKLLIKIQGFLEDNGNPEIQREFYEEMYKSWIYCSDEVVEATNHLMDLVALSEGERPQDPKGHKALGSLVVAIRKDLLGKSNLDHSKFKYRMVPKIGS